eukprot:1323443-Pyramimonas_sp.AAC.1
MHRSPTVLIARIKAPNLDLTVAVTHAPHHHADIAKRQQWWQQLRECMQQWSVNVLLTDASGQVGSNLIGGIHAGHNQPARKSDLNGK